MMRIDLYTLLLDVFVFAGHALTLFLLSISKYQLSIKRRLWLGVFLLTISFPTCGTLLGWETPDFFWHMSALGICGAAFLLSSVGPRLQNLFLFASYINYFVFSFAAARGLAAGLMYNDPLAVIVLHLCFILAFCVVVSCDIRPFFTKMEHHVHKGWFSLTMLAAIFSVCLVGLLITSDFFAHGDRMIIMMLLALFIIMASAYVVIFMMIQTMNLESREQKLELEGKFLREQLTAYKQAEHESRKNRHDSRHHNLVILEYAKEGDCGAIIRYLQEYEAAAESVRFPRFCANVTVNSIVAAFARRAREQGIRMTVDIRMGTTLFVKDTHIVAILANLLENALKGSLLSQEAPWVELLMVYRNQRLVIQCRNSCAERILFKDGIPQAEGRTGMGAASVVDTVSEYAGNAEFSAADGVFTCRLALNDLNRTSN